jgi:dCMP deaminase
MNKVTELKTKPEVLHAESNAIAKLAKSSESGDGASMFITCSPCIDCAKMIFQSGIKEVFYGEDYRDNKGIEFLNKCNIPVRKVA